MQSVPDPSTLGFDPAGLASIESHLRGYVVNGELSGFELVLARWGQVALSVSAGMRDREAGLPMGDDTLIRVYSMTKVVTAVAMLQLVEQGKVSLEDRLDRFIPEFAHTKVWSGSVELQRGGVVEPITLRHLLTHTSGLTYGFLHANPVDAMYRAAGFDWGTPPGWDLETSAKSWAALPLLFPPGRAWNYSVGFDLLGRVVEVASGLQLPDYFRRRILGPLGMVDSGFYANEEQSGRLAALYSADVGAASAPQRAVGLESYALFPPTCPSGGGGLLSTARDYQRFIQMLMNRGELQGTRVLTAPSVNSMFTNQLPGNVGLDSIGIPMSPNTDFAGRGYGFGLSIVLDPDRVSAPCARGEVSADGAASTFFWIDPEREISALFLAQLMPSSRLPLRQELRQLVHVALLER